MKISRREYQIAELIAWGASDKEVADELCISFQTAKTHRKNILKKINGHNAADLTRWFFQKKCGISLGLNPRQVRHLAFIFLLLVCVGEYTNQNMIRTARVARVTKTVRTSRGRSRRKDEKTLTLKAA